MKSFEQILRDIDNGEEDIVISYATSMTEEQGQYLLISLLIIAP